MPPPCPKSSYNAFPPAQSSYDASPMPTEFLECLPPALCSALGGFPPLPSLLERRFLPPNASPILATPSYIPSVQAQCLPLPRPQCTQSCRMQVNGTVRRRRRESGGFKNITIIDILYLYIYVLPPHLYQSPISLVW